MLNRLYPEQFNVDKMNVLMGNTEDIGGNQGRQAPGGESGNFGLVIWKNSRSGGQSTALLKNT